MSRKKFVMFALLVCGFAVPPFVGKNAYAEEPPLYFYPEHTWNIARLNPEEALYSFCTISNTMNNGYFVEFSGDKRGFNKVTINFKQDVFRQEQKYEVEYTIPGITRAVIPSRAADGGIMMSDLSHHANFAAQLSDAGVVDVRIGESSFRLYLTGLKVKMSAFSACTRESNEFSALSAQNAPLPISGSNDFDVDNEDRVWPPRNNIKNMHSPEPVYTMTKSAEPISVDFTGDRPVPMPMSGNSPITPDIPLDTPLTGLTGKDEKGDFLAMRQKISSLEHQTKVLTDKNGALNEELQETLQDAQQERLSVSSDNWNLERATMRYNEAERQIQRLGRKLQTHQAQCDIEKSSLENMLFDPKVTGQQQLVKLSALENELNQTKSEMLRQQRRYEEKIRLLTQQLEVQ